MIELDLAGPGRPPLPVRWDATTGTLDGPGANRLRVLLASIARDGYVIGPPYPTTYPIADPLHRPAEMARVLAAEGLSLPDALTALLSTAADDMPPDAVA